MTGSIPEGIRGGPEPHLELIRNETEARGPILSISGRIDLEAYGRLSDEWQTFRAAIAADPPERISIDLGAAASVDSAGALLLIRIENDLRDCGVSTEFDPVPEDVRGMLALTRRHAGVEPAAAGRTSGPNWLTRIGDASLRAKQEFVTLMTFFGDMIVALSGVLRVPLPVFVLLVAIAKTGRYVVLAWLGAATFGT